MITQLRHETCSGAIQDLGHVSTLDCLSDCLTKEMKATTLIKMVSTGIIQNCDLHPPFREMMKQKHKAYLAAWIIRNVSEPREVTYFMMEPIRAEINHVLATGLQNY